MAGVLGIIKNVLVPTNQIFISLKQEKYWEGDVVEGEVTVLSLEFPYAAFVELKFKGVARADLKYASSKVRLHDAIASQVIKLFEGEITQREQTFKFQFTLPKECPGTFLYKNPEDKNESVGIYYYAKAKLKVPYRFDQKVREKFEIFEKQKKLATPLRAYSTSSKNGLDVWIDRNTFCPGDRVIIRLKLAHNEKVSVMQMRLVQGIEYEKTGKILHVAEPKTLKITPPPHYYYGTTWVEFYIPLEIRPSTLLGDIRMIYFLKFDVDNSYKVLVPINILERQPISSLHPIPPPNATLPPPCEIRPPMQSNEVSICSLCGTEFTLLKGKTHCRHCGKIFCKSCVNTKIVIPKLWFNEPEKVCRACVRIVEETRGVKYQTPKKVMEEWSKQPEVQWVPKCSKKDYGWVKTKFQAKDFICYSAKDPALWAADEIRPGEFVTLEPPPMPQKQQHELV